MAGLATRSASSTGGPRLLGLADTPARSMPTGAHLARVNRVPLSLADEETDPMLRRTVLTGIGALTTTTILGVTPAGAAVDPVDAVESALLNPPLTGRPVAVPQLACLIGSARTVFQQGQYAQLAATLPGLLSTVLATRTEATTGEDIAVVDRYTAQLYVLASELGVKLSRDRLAWTSADRALQAAHGSGDILTQASARRAWGIVLRRHGDTDTAQQLILDTAAALQPDLRRGPEHLSVYGSLAATASYTAAGRGDRDTARTLLGEALDTARRVGADANHRGTAFGPTAVGMYQVSIARVLGEPTTAIQAARRINPAAIPFGEQRARYWSNVARALFDLGQFEPCYRALLAAERESADEVRYRRPIQKITTSLLGHATAHALPGLRAFAARTGVVA
ncbi:MAG: hypothetical protein ACRDQ5_28405 [Sciscionella sp.]